MLIFEVVAADAVSKSKPVFVVVLQPVCSQSRWSGQDSVNVHSVAGWLMKGGGEQWVCSVQLLAGVSVSMAWVPVANTAQRVREVVVCSENPRLICGRP